MLYEVITDMALAQRITGTALPEFAPPPAEALSVARYRAIDTLLEGVLRTRNNFV